MPITRFTAGVCLVVAALAAGPGAAAGLLAQGTAPVVPFKIAVPDAVLADLKERLARTRFPSEIEGSGWDYGTNLAYLSELVTYWRTTFDWRAQERKLNQLPQFKTHDRRPRHPLHPPAIEPCRRHAAGHDARLAGLDLRVHEDHRPAHRAGQLGGNASDAFHVVALSLPGYGFSGKPTQRRLQPGASPRIIAQLMARLGYTRYGAQGGDWGGIIVRQLGLVDPQHLIGAAQQHVRGRPAARAESERRRAGRGD